MHHSTESNHPIVIEKPNLTGLIDSLAYFNDEPKEPRWQNHTSKTRFSPNYYQLVQDAPLYIEISALSLGLNLI